MNRLYNLPPELLNKIYEYDGGAYYKTIFSSYVLPSMIKECWSRWKRNYVERYRRKYLSSKKKIFPFANTTKKYSYSECMDYYSKKRQYEHAMVLLEFLEKHYWNRMYTCPIDSFEYVLSRMDTEITFEDNESHGSFGIYWDRCKAFPFSSWLNGNIVEKMTFHKEYKMYREYSGIYYYRADSSRWNSYKILYYSKKWKMYVLKLESIQIDDDDSDMEDVW